MPRRRTNYKPILVRVMSFLDDEEYNEYENSTQEQLGGLTPDKLMMWSMPTEPPTGHDMNSLVRSHTIKYWKKALSSFMANRLMPWNEISGVGNPTRSRALNDLIKHVKKKEARAQGAPSQARRSIKEAEIRRVIELLKEEEDIIKKYGKYCTTRFRLQTLTQQPANKLGREK
jgi:hypothetical protein